MKLLFVYNAQNDLLSKSLDYAHKLLRPSTYRCELCQLTHHAFGERKLWQDFQQESGVEMEFLYIADFEKRFGKNVGMYPMVLEEVDGAWKIWISKSELKQVAGIEEFIQTIKLRQQSTLNPKKTSG
ncbi:MAG: hypothetical protein A3D92_22070 [Bacteroidetes bacterium RIFCSPHIGHO2_02_FULL_44_7]|nr:MAG: hypothetical protein A3D92_22070 [Bacteroidetes bacterium RIFCSPHIGHO2_02_FULL_44_7]